MNSVQGLRAQGMWVGARPPSGGTQTAVTAAPGDTLTLFALPPPVTAAAPPSTAKPAADPAASSPLSDVQQTELKHMLGPRPFFIPREKVEQIQQKLGVSSKDLLRALVPIAREYARPGVSGFKVGAAAMGASGNVYLGVNLEFRNEDGHQTVHGEQFTVANAMLHGEKQLTTLAVSAPPCGHCRQFLSETNDSDKLLVLYDGKERTLAELLPDAFGGGGDLLDSPLNRPLAILDADAHDDRSLLKAAKEAQERAYAHNNDPSSIAMRLHDGSIYAGSYAEVRGQNPSLSPLQSALIAVVMDGKPYDAIEDVVLLEKQGSNVTQSHSVEGMLAEVAPKATLEIRHDGVRGSQAPGA